MSSFARYGTHGSERSYKEPAPSMVLFPGLAIVVVVLGFNVLGDGLRMG
jgi:ABC-type dipeptide/oligopeptide/nickel transport system permease subunit